MNLKEWWFESKERNAAAVEQRADRLMADTGYDWLRTRRWRTALVAAYAVSLVVVAVCFVALGDLAGLLALVAAGCLWGLLRLSVRTIADLPEDYLDERQAAVRNGSYVESYRWLAAFVGVLASAGLLAFIFLGQDPQVWHLRLSWGAVMAIFWVSLGLILALPSMIIALRARI